MKEILCKGDFTQRRFYEGDFNYVAICLYINWRPNRNVPNSFLQSGYKTWRLKKGASLLGYKSWRLKEGASLLASLLLVIKLPFHSRFVNRVTVYF